MRAKDAPVVVIGAGPTGITAATLLAQYGVEVLVLDRWAGVYPQPRAVHLDDEVFRIIDRLGVAEEFAKISRPALGLRLLDPQMTVLAQFHRDPSHAPPRRRGARGRPLRGPGGAGAQARRDRHRTRARPRRHRRGGVVVGWRAPAE